MKKIITIAFVALSIAACGSDDSAERQDDMNVANDNVEEAVDNTVAAMKIDTSMFADAAVITEADVGGMKGLNLSGVVDGAGYAKCGLATGDQVKMIDGAAVPGGRDGVQSLIKACSMGKAVTIMRGGEEMSVSAP